MKKKNKEENVQTKEINKDKKTKFIVEEIEKEKKQEKKLPKEYEKKANKNIFRNVIIAIVILAFCILKILGYMNIKEDIFIVDLKTFSISILIFSIILFERSYKRIDLTLFTHGLEALFVAIVTLCEVYIYQLFIDKFVMVIAIESLLISVYYIIKCIKIYSKIKKEYRKSLSDISEIVKEEKVIKIETHRKKSKRVEDKKQTVKEEKNIENQEKKEENKDDLKEEQESTKQNQEENKKEKQSNGQKQNSQNKQKTNKNSNKKSKKKKKKKK